MRKGDKFYKVEALVSRSDVDEKNSKIMSECKSKSSIICFREFRTVRLLVCISIPSKTGVAQATSNFLLPTCSTTQTLQLPATQRSLW